MENISKDSWYEPGFNWSTCGMQGKSGNHYFTSLHVK